MTKNRLPQIAANTSIVAATVFVGLVALEVGLRLVNGIPATPWSDWRKPFLIQQNESSANRYDETLGWVLRDFLETDSLNTIEHGIRRNSPDTVLARGEILASGDSFTAGSEVSDHESWPAHLETILGRPVMNGGNGGYGTDQIVVRAEQLMDVLQPEIVVLGFFDQDILRAGFSRYGENKLYYVDTSDGLELKNVPVPPPDENKALDSEPGLIETLYLPAVITSAVSGKPIFVKPPSSYRKISNDPVTVSCALLDRIKRKTLAADTHLILVMQYGGQVHHTRVDRPAHAQLVLDCARDLAIPVIDEFDAIRAISEESSKALQSLYVMGAGEFNFGHMSSAGNQLVAGLIADAIAELPDTPQTPAAGPGYLVSRYTKPLGNLLTPAQQALDTSAYSNGIVDVSRLWWGQDGFELATKGPNGEHYLSLPPVPDLPAGRYELHVELRTGSTDRVRLQLLHSAATGILADFNLSEQHADITRLGPVQRIGAETKQALRGGDWKDASVYAEYPAGDIRILVQFLAPDGASSIPGDGTDFDIANIRLLGFVAE